MPPISHKHVSPEEMAREAIKLTEVLAKVLVKEGAVPPPMCSILGKHYVNNPEGNACVKCEHCMQWFRWDYGEHKYIPL